MRNYKDYQSLFNFKIKNRANYDLALTHPSCNLSSVHHDYERLEFIGDSVLGFIAADLVFKLHPEFGPGEMTRLKSLLVKSSALAKYARSIELYNFIHIGNSINPSQLKESNKILEDVFEAIIGAIYYDQGYEVTYNFVKSFIEKDIMNFNPDDLVDYKTKLQELLQADYHDSVKYQTIKEEGPVHDRTFYVNVIFNSVILGTGSGKSKKSAEESAAKEALSKWREI